MVYKKILLQLIRLGKTEIVYLLALVLAQFGPMFITHWLFKGGELIVFLVMCASLAPTLFILVWLPEGLDKKEHSLEQELKARLKR